MKLHDFSQNQTKQKEKEINKEKTNYTSPQRKHSTPHARTLTHAPTLTHAYTHPHFGTSQKH